MFNAKEALRVLQQILDSTLHPRCMGQSWKQSTKDPKQVFSLLQDSEF